jgi:hypothetical protein
MTKEAPQQVVLKNVRVKYAKLIRPGAAFDEGQPDLWSVNMYVTTEDEGKLFALGVSPKTDKEDQAFYVAKRNVTSKTGAPVKPPSLVDAKKQPVTEEVGNGSVCNIAVTPFAWKKGAKTGVILYLNAVQVINHVPFGNFDPFTEIEVPDAPPADDNDGLPW